jgi:hypothetical protein
LEANVKKQPINSFLILPVQRLPRYQLLAESLLKYTSLGHPDHSQLEQAVKKIINVNSYVEAKKDEFEHRHRVQTIQHKFGSKLVCKFSLFLVQVSFSDEIFLSFRNCVNLIEDLSWRH